MSIDAAIVLCCTGTPVSCVKSFLLFLRVLLAVTANLAHGSWAPATGHAATARSKEDASPSQHAGACLPMHWQQISLATVRMELQSGFVSLVSVGE